MCRPGVDYGNRISFSRRTWADTFNSTLKAQIVRFVLVGVLNTTVGYLTYLALLSLGLHYILSAGLGTLIGVIFNFFTAGTLVFHNLHIRLFTRFVVSYGIITTSNMGMLWLLYQIGLDPVIGQAVCLPPVAVAAYFLQSVFVFGK